MLLVWEPNWYLTYHYWPTAYNRHIFEGTLYFVPPKTATRAPAQELAAVTFKEYALQDGNTLEATQRSIESRAVTQLPAERPGDPAAPPAQDARDHVADYQARQAETPVRSRPCHEPAPPSSPTSSRSPTGASRPRRERYAKRLASTMDELQAFYDAAFPRLEDAIAYLDGLDLDALPDDATRLLWLLYSLVNASFPVEVWRQPRVPDSGAAGMDMVVEPAV